MGQFKIILNYVSQPACLEYIDEIPVTREKHVIDFILEIINYTNDDIKDILVRCCRFHKIGFLIEKTVTKSCINYENDLVEYIKNG